MIDIPRLKSVVQVRWQKKFDLISLTLFLLFIHKQRDPVCARCLEKKSEAPADSAAFVVQIAGSEIREQLL